MTYRARSALLAAFALLALGADPALAGIHTWDVSEVFSNADGTIQFVELVEANGGNAEGGVGNGSISSNTKVFNWANGAVANTANKKYLVATPAFASLPGAPTPNAIISAGTLPFFFQPSGDTVSFAVYDSCVFGAIPTDGVHSFDCVTNTTVVNSPTNFAGTSGSVIAAIAPGLVSNFQDGTLQNWTGGSAPTNIANGGPAGAGDRYLQISATSNFLGVFNKVQWSGNYIAAQIDHIDMNLKNFGPNPVSIRIMLLTAGCDFGGTLCTAWTSTLATPVSAGSSWITASFSVKEINLTRVLGSQSYAASLSNVERILIRHDDGTPNPPTSGVAVSATLGIDNVLPEPSFTVALAVGAALIGGLSRTRRRSRPR